MRKIGHRSGRLQVDPWVVLPRHLENVVGRPDCAAGRSAVRGSREANAFRVGQPFDFFGTLSTHTPPRSTIDIVS